MVDMKGGRFSPGQAYVAFSRVKNLEGLHVLNFNPKAIKASRDVKIEMERLSKNLSNPLPLFTCPSVSDNYITVALLNVRSIVPEIPDIHHDSSLKCANILCFMEIWLTSAQATPVLYDDHTISSCNRLSGDNKGGVRIGLPHTMRPANIIEFSFTGILIEAVSSTLVLPNGERLQITLVYRSPSVSTDIMLNVISGILGQITVRDMPSIVLGDFNEDLLTIPDSRLLHHVPLWLLAIGTNSHY